MRLHFYTICWNDAPLIPYFLRYYRPLCDRIVMYDNYSTDGTQDLLRAAGCEVYDWAPSGNSVCEAAAAFKGNIWKESRKQADWVLVADMDEFLWHSSGLLPYLKKCQGQGVTAIQGIGYDMISSKAPTGPQQLYQLVRRGIRHDSSGKTCIFNPDEVEDVQYWPGCHKCVVSGKVLYPVESPYLLHFRYLGMPDTYKRFQELNSKLLPGDFENNYGHFYAQPWPVFRSRYFRLLRASRLVPFLTPQLRSNRLVGRKKVERKKKGR